MIYSTVYPIKKVLSGVRSGRVRLDGDWIRVGRFATFVEKGTKCSVCGVEGLFFRKEKGVRDSNWHVNLYGFKDEKFVMLTKDHIIPRSLGGKNHLDNYQPMCEWCNGRKGNRVSLLEKFKVTAIEYKTFVTHLRKIWL